MSCQGYQPRRRCPLAFFKKIFPQNSLLFLGFFLVRRWLDSLDHRLEILLSHSFHVALGSSSISTPFQQVVLVLLLVLMVPVKHASQLQSIILGGVRAQTILELNLSMVVELHKYKYLLCLLTLKKSFWFIFYIHYLVFVFCFFALLYLKTRRGRPP